MDDFDPDDLERRMNGALENLKSELSGLRTGRASTGLLEPIMVEAYGAPMPLNQVGTISVPEARMLSVQVWDRGLVTSVEKAIINSGLGLNPMTEGSTIRIPIPILSEERRVELTKVAGKYTEDARIAVRNVRRNGMDTLKKMQKDGDISEDDQKIYADEIQGLTDKTIDAMNRLLSQKEEEILQV